MALRIENNEIICNGCDGLAIPMREDDSEDSAMQCGACGEQFSARDWDAAEQALAAEPKIDT